MNNTNRIKTGRLCINKPREQLEKLLHESKTSRENKARNNKKIIVSILGVQNSHPEILFGFIKLKNTADLYKLC